MIPALLLKSFLRPKLILGVIVTLSVVFGFYYVKNLQKEVSSLQAQLDYNELLLEAKEQEIETWKMSMQFSQELQQDLHSKLEKARVDAVTSKKVFDEHDFKYLLEKKPGLMARRMRDGTQRMFVAIEAEANN